MYAGTYLYDEFLDKINNFLRFLGVHVYNKLYTFHAYN